MVTWNELVEEAEARFVSAGIAEPGISARWIARQATGTDAAEWLEVADRSAGKRSLASFDGMVERRCTGEPLQYVLGSWGFRSLDLFVDRRVLIPRPETEIVAEKALIETDRVRRETPIVADGPSIVVADGPSIVVADGPSIVVADLGTGSGAIGLAVAMERPGTEVWLTDASPGALQVARANLAGLGRAGGGVRVAEGSWFSALPDALAGRISVVVSNPPYVSSAADLEPQVAQWEPASALLAAQRGLIHLIELIDQAPRWLVDHGALVLEMAPDQVSPMIERAAGLFTEVEPVEDLAGRLRGLVARFPR